MKQLKEALIIAWAIAVFFAVPTWAYVNGKCALADPASTWREIGIYVGVPALIWGLLIVFRGFIFGIKVPDANPSDPVGPIVSDLRQEFRVVTPDCTIVISASTTASKEVEAAIRNVLTTAAGGKP